MENSLLQVTADEPHFCHLMPSGFPKAMTSFLLYSYWRFHLRRLVQIHPFMSASLSCGAFALVLAISFYVEQMHMVALARQELELQRRTAASKALNTPTSSATSVGPTLPWFRSTELIAQFGQLADEIKMPIDETAYLLEEAANRPYLRYRVTLTVAASYPVIRRFVAALSENMKNVDLDSISCTRADITVAPLTCELAFSAFFRKDAHG